MYYAIQEVANGNYSGSHSINVQVNGERTMRIYTVTWTNGEGKIVIDRQDIFK